MQTRHYSAHVYEMRNELTWYDYYLRLFCGGEFVAAKAP